MLKKIVPPRGKRRGSPVFIVVFVMIILMLFLARAGFGTGTVDRSSAQSLFEEANALYASGDFGAALEGYERLAEAGVATREVLANAGNAAWQMDDPGRAVLYYKRALRLDPGYDLARQNLDRIQPETNLIAEDSFGDLVARAFARNSGWLFLVMAELLFMGLLLSLVMVVRGRPGSEARGDWWSRSVALALLFVVAGGLVALHGAARTSDGDAVVMLDGAVSRLEPSEQAPGQLELPGGTVIHLASEPRDGWVRFRMRDGSVGFIETRVIERI